MNFFSNFFKKSSDNKSRKQEKKDSEFLPKKKAVIEERFIVKFIENGGDPFYAASKLNNQEKAIIKYSIGRCFSSCKLNCLKNCNGTPVAMGLQKKLILLTTKFEGTVGMFFDIPRILAPKYFKQRVSHDPLKPVCPVIKIFLFLKIFINFFELFFLII